MVKRLRRGIDTLLQMQQEFLTIANKHVQTRIEEQRPARSRMAPAWSMPPAMPWKTSSAPRRNSWMSIVEEESKPKGGRAEDGKKKTEMSALAREAASAFIDAQKSLLDLAGQQVNVNLQAASRVADMTKVLRLNPFPTITGEGVKSFVDAEKAVLDSLMKPTKSPAKPASAAKRTARRRAGGGGGESGKGCHHLSTVTLSG